MTPYDILGISQGASEEEIKKAYRSAAKKAHPDTGGSPEDFQRIQQAYDSIRNKSSVRTEVFRRYADLTAVVEISLEDAFNGRIIDINGQVVEIPAGIQHGQMIRVYGGGYDIEGVTGDMTVIVRVHRHPVFTVQSHHLHRRLQISAIEAIYGATFNIRGIDGKVLEVVIPPASQPDSVVVLKGEGMPWGDTRGDLGIHLSIYIPTPQEADAAIDLKRN